jgi:hypothetical protein
MSIGVQNHHAAAAGGRALTAALSLGALFLLLAALTAWVVSTVDPAVLDQAYAVYFTT